MKAYSKDLRLKVLGAVDRGMNRREVADVFGVSLASIKRWLKMRRERGDVEARPIPGPPARKRAMLLEWLPSQLASNPVLTLDEHCEAFEQACGVKVCKGDDVPDDIAAFWRLAAQKKSPIAQERDDEKRGLWKWLASRFEARRLVFVDESGFQISMMRLRSRAPRGKRAYGRIPRNRGKNQTLIASITLEGGMGACMCVTGGTDAPVFEAYVEKVLAPSLVEGQVVILDNLGAHQPQRIRELIEARGCDLGSVCKGILDSTISRDNCPTKLRCRPHDAGRCAQRSIPGQTGTGFPDRNGTLLP